jgi:hypothetical protein
LADVILVADFPGALFDDHVGLTERAGRNERQSPNHHQQPFH